MFNPLKLLILRTAVTLLLFSACRSVIPVPTAKPELQKTTTVLPAASPEPMPKVTSDQETALSKETGPECPPPSETVDIAPQTYGRAAGGSPVWAIINRPELVFSLDEVQQLPLSEHGYQYKVLWVIEKTYPEEVTLQGGSFKDETPLWFEMGGEEPTTRPVLDTRNPGAFSNPDYVDFPSYLFIPGAGCFFVEASWNEGSWRINITVTE